MSKDVRAQAAQVVRAVLVEGRSLADALPARSSQLGAPRDRALLQELTYGTLRWYYRLNALLDQLLDRPLKARDSDVRALLLVGLYQLCYQATPQRVAVHETVHAVAALRKDWARGLVNAVLRNYQRRATQLQQAVDDDPQAHHAHPAWFMDTLQTDWPQAAADILAANNQRPPMCLRVNAARLTRAEYLSKLHEAGHEAHALPHAPEAVMLARPVPVEQLPGFAAGDVSVQDGAAQLAAGLLAAENGERVLDACAAPGGKSAHLLERQPGIQLTALDIDAHRLQRVADNLARSSVEAHLIQGDAAEPADWWDGLAYDRILLDAPCSATGVIRRHPDIKCLRRAADVAALAELQARILRSLWPLLSPGGMLLYCTCSVLQDENSRQITAFLDAHADAGALPITADWGHACSQGRQILPGEDEMDGFYYACLRKLA